MLEDYAAFKIINNKYLLLHAEICRDLRNIRLSIKKASSKQIYKVD